MNEKLATEILAMHADVLMAGIDTTEILARRYPPLAGMLGVAQQLGRSFVPVPASAEFRHRLYQELLRTHVTGPVPVRSLSTSWIAGAAIGSVVTGLAVWLAHRSGSRAVIPRVAA
jgi:hypothetical protein